MKLLCMYGVEWVAAQEEEEYNKREAEEIEYRFREKEVG